MIGYLKKVFLDILPPVTATVIGAFIVTNYVAPKQQADAPKVEAATPVAEKLVHGANGMAPRDVETVAVKPQDPAEAKQEAKGAKPQEAKSQEAKAQAVKPQDTKPQDTKRHEAAKLAPAQPVQTPPVEAKTAPAGVDEKRDAAEMARAALDRLRGSQTPPAHTAAPQAPLAQTAVVIPTTVPAAPTVIPAAPATASAAPSTGVPALPPPVVIIPPREERSVFGERMSPPADIPGGRAMASSEDRSLLGGIAGAARSLVDVVIPR